MKYKEIKVGGGSLLAVMRQDNSRISVGWKIKCIAWNMIVMIIFLKVFGVVSVFIMDIKVTLSFINHNDSESQICTSMAKKTSLFSHKQNINNK